MCVEDGLSQVQSHFIYLAIAMDVKYSVNDFILKETLLAHADFPGYVEDSAKRAYFTITQHHHSKLFLPACLVSQDQLHKANSKESNAVSKNAASGMKLSQGRKNSGKPDTGVCSHMGIDNETLEEMQRAGIDPDTVEVAHQKKALKQFAAEQMQQLAKPKKNKEMIEQKNEYRKPKMN